MSTTNQGFAITYGPFDVTDNPVTVDHVVVSVTDSAGNTQTQNISDGAASATFSNVAIGSGTMSAQAVDAAGNAIGPAATGTFTATAPTVTEQIPTAIKAA